MIDWRNMFGTAPEPTEHDIVRVPDDTVPVSMLALDLGEAPAEGWAAYFAARNVPVQADDLGRLAVARSAARMLLVEHRQREAEMARHRKAAEAQAVADDQLRRSRI
jgi:hypothetical protein